MADVVVFVNHTKKEIVVVEYDHLWIEMKTLFSAWYNDSVEIVRERDDFSKLRYLVISEKYKHNLGEVFS